MRTRRCVKPPHGGAEEPRHCSLLRLSRLGIRICAQPPVLRGLVTSLTPSSEISICGKTAAGFR